MSNESKSEELIKIESLSPRSRGVNIIVGIVSKSEERIVSNGEHRVSDALVGDETGSIILTLWDDTIDKVSVGEAVHITNGYVNLFRSNMRLNTGRYGTIDVLEESPVKEVNTENNLSEKEYEQERRYNRRSDYRRDGGSNYRGRSSRRRRY